MINAKKTLLENFLSLGSLKILFYIVPLIYLPYLSRILSVEHFGQVFFAFAFIQYFVILTDFGFELSATREIAVNRHNKNNLSNIFNSVILLKFILLVVSFLILSTVIYFVPKLRADWLLFMFAFLSVFGIVISPIWFFQGMERMKYITFVNILSRLIFLVLIFVFVKHDSNYVLVPLIDSLGYIVSGLIGFVFAVKNFNIKLYIPKINSIKRQFKYSLEFFLSRVSVAIYTNTNTFCLGLIGSNIMVGYYVAAEKLYTAITGLNYPLNQAIYPYVAKNKDLKLYKKLFFIALSLNFFVCIFVWFFAKWIVTLFYGVNMLEAYKVLKIFVLIALVVFPSQMIGYPLLGAMGHTNEANKSVIIGSIIHITGLLILFITNKMNIYSIACMVLITECAVFCMRAYAVKKYKLLEISK